MAKEEVPQQKNCLEILAKIAKPGAILAIFDYTSPEKNNIPIIKDLAGNPMRPLVLKYLKKWLDETGWDLLEIKNLDIQYQQWYEKFLNQLNDKKQEMLKEFSDNSFINVKNTLTSLLNHIKNKDIGGAFIFARLKNPNALFFKDHHTKMLDDSNKMVPYVRSKL